MIPVTKPFLPEMHEYNQFVKGIWESNWLTNNGVHVHTLEKELSKCLEVSSVYFVSNGTMALQLSLKALRIKGEVITTPFSFVATTTSLLWEGCKPVFVDIDASTLCIDTRKIENAITDKTEAILATHVYGNPCDVKEIEKIAQKFQLKVIYDAAHTFGVKYCGESILSYGDISTLSFHATKLFHTVEGGGIVNNTGYEIDKYIRQLRNFGVEDNEYQVPGINAKNSEFHAAMGLCNLKYMDEIISERKSLTQIYDSFLLSVVRRPDIDKEVEYNYAYYPIILQSEEELLVVKKHLENHHIQSRRYFYPSLNNLPYIEDKIECLNSEDIAKRVLCLPLFNGLEANQVEKISELVLERVK